MFSTVQSLGLGLIVPTLIIYSQSSVEILDSFSTFFAFVVVNVPTTWYWIAAYALGYGGSFLVRIYKIKGDKVHGLPSKGSQYLYLLLVSSEVRLLS